MCLPILNKTGAHIKVDNEAITENIITLSKDLSTLTAVVSGIWIKLKTDPTSSTRAKMIPCDELGKQIEMPIVSKVYVIPLVAEIKIRTNHVFPIKYDKARSIQVTVTAVYETRVRWTSRCLGLAFLYIHIVQSLNKPIAGATITAT